MSLTGDHEIKNLANYLCCERKEVEIYFLSGDFFPIKKLTLNFLILIGRKPCLFLKRKKKL